MFQSKCKDTIFFCLNHDFSKIFRITKIFLTFPKFKTLEKLKNEKKRKKTSPLRAVFICLNYDYFGYSISK